MNIKKIVRNGVEIAVIEDAGVFLADAGAALDLLAAVRYEAGCERAALSKSALPEDFFRLGTGLAGEIVQKFVNYRFKAAVYGDFSGYASEPLRAFMRESNRGRDFFFAATEEEAVDRLAGAR